MIKRLLVRYNYNILLYFYRGEKNQPEEKGNRNNSNASHTNQSNTPKLMNSLVPNTATIHSNPLPTHKTNNVNNKKLVLSKKAQDR